jgi:hypothetical protein
MALHGIGGFGYGSFSFYEPDASASSVVSYRNRRAAVFNVGAGFELRMSPKVGWKTEYRHYLPLSSRVGDALGYHHRIFPTGIAFHH